MPCERRGVDQVGLQAVARSRRTAARAPRRCLCCRRRASPARCRRAPSPAPTAQTRAASMPPVAEGHDPVAVASPRSVACAGSRCAGFAAVADQDRARVGAIDQHRRAAGDVGQHAPRTRLAVGLTPMTRPTGPCSLITGLPTAHAQLVPASISWKKRWRRGRAIPTARIWRFAPAVDRRLGADVEQRLVAAVDVLERRRSRPGQPRAGPLASSGGGSRRWRRSSRRRSRWRDPTQRSAPARRTRPTPAPGGAAEAAAHGAESRRPAGLSRLSDTISSTLAIAPVQRRHGETPPSSPSGTPRSSNGSIPVRHGPDPLHTPARPRGTRSPV